MSENARPPIDAVELLDADKNLEHTIRLGFVVKVFWVEELFVWILDRPLQFESLSESTLQDRRKQLLDEGGT